MNAVDPIGPNLWKAGGYIAPVEWDRVEFLKLWSGEQKVVGPGDTVLVWYTGLPGARYVGIKRLEARA